MSDKTSDKTSDLKLCPFCGGEAEFYRTPVKTNGGWCDSVVVRCKNCEARTNRVLYNGQKHKNDSEYDEAAEAWNQRKPMERIMEKFNELERLSFSRISKPLIDLEDAIRIIKEEGGLND